MSTYRVDVGTPPENFEGWTSINVCFHGFADLTTTRGERVESPKFSRFGHRWRLRLFPGGDKTSDEGYAAITLCNCSDTSIKIQWGFSIRDSDGKEVVHLEPDTDEFAEVGVNKEAPRYSSWGYSHFARRSTLMELLVQGSLVIEVRIKLPSTDNKATQFIPTNPFNKNMLELFMDEESADVVFEVGGEQSTGTTTRKKSKTTTNFHAHRLILKNNTSALYDMCKSGEEGITTVSITDIQPNIFRHMIYYTYGGKLSEEDLKNNAKDIINACDKYGVVHLKLEAEATYVKLTEFTMDNIMDNLLYADSKNLALLKESVMDYILANKGDIVGKVSFNNFPGHLVADLLTAMSRGEQSGDGDSTDYNKMRVGTLRKMLDEKGLDVDGSREAIIALLKEHDDSDEDDDDNDD